jgi:hypothetical protein
MWKWSPDFSTWCLSQTAQLHDFNTMFQTSDPVLHHLHGKVHKPVKSILSDFMKMDVVRSCDPFTVSLDHPNLGVPTDQVYLGIQATTTLQEYCSQSRSCTKLSRCQGEIVWNSCWRQ